MTPTKIFDLPHCDARALLRRGFPVYLPVNPVEYHGPHLSLHNDRLISHGLVADLHRALHSGGDVPLLVAHDLEVGVDPCQGPGSRHVSFGVARRLVVESCRALVDLGATKIVLMTFHGAPLHDAVLAEAASFACAHGARAVSPLNAVLRSMLVLDDPAPYEASTQHVANASVRNALLDRLSRDFHAGFFETSVALHYAETSVARGYERVPPCEPITPAPVFVSLANVARSFGREMLSRELLFAAHGAGWNALRPFPGYTSMPSYACREAGAFFAKQIVEEMVGATRRVFEGEPPAPPIMSWLRALTFGGRVPTSSIPLDSVLRVELSHAGAT